MAIHHLFFPHIVDLIFEYATFESLVVMSAVCRGWRQRALPQIEHLHVDLHSGTYSLPSYTLFANAARHCRLLDIDVDQMDSPSMSKLTTLAAPGLRVDTLRLKRTTYLHKPRWLPAARRIVFSSFQQRRWMHFPSKLLFQPGEREGGWKVVEKLVINHEHVGIVETQGCRNPERGGSTAALFPQLKDIVLILHGDGACAHCIVKLLDEASDVSATVTVVGVETLNTWHPLWPYHIDGNSVVKVQDNLKFTLPGVVIMSHKKYRQSIGEKEYALETSWQRPSHFQTYDLSDNMRRIDTSGSE